MVTERKRVTIPRKVRPRWIRPAQHLGGRQDAPNHRNWAKGTGHEGSEAVKVKTPNTCPFLVNVHGYNPSQDCVVYPISHRCVKVGSDRKLMAKNIFLTAPDILLKHLRTTTVAPKGKGTTVGWEKTDRKLSRSRVVLPAFAVPDSQLHPGAPKRAPSNGGKPQDEQEREAPQTGTFLKLSGQVLPGFVFWGPPMVPELCPRRTPYGPPEGTKKRGDFRPRKPFSPQKTPGKSEGREIKKTALRGLE